MTLNNKLYNVIYYELVPLIRILVMCWTYTSIFKKLTHTEESKHKRKKITFCIFTYKPSITTVRDSIGKTLAVII